MTGEEKKLYIEFMKDMLNGGRTDDIEVNREYCGAITYKLSTKDILNFYNK